MFNCLVEAASSDGRNTGKELRHMLWFPFSPPFFHKHRLLSGPNFPNCNTERAIRWFIKSLLPLNLYDPSGTTKRKLNLSRSAIRQVKSVNKFPHVSWRQQDVVASGWSTCLRNNGKTTIPIQREIPDFSLYPASSLEEGISQDESLLNAPQQTVE